MQNGSHKQGLLALLVLAEKTLCKKQSFAGEIKDKKNTTELTVFKFASIRSVATEYVETSYFLCDISISVTQF